MAESDTDRTRRLAELLPGDGQPDMEAFLSLMDEKIVWDVSRSPFPDAGVYHGVPGVRAWLEGVRAAFGPPAYVIEDARESGDRVAVLIHLQGRGPSSEIEVDYRFTAVMTFHGERIVRMDRYDDWAAAIAALER